ncbi:hypothetical protein [Bradyrhizobium sp. dw_78]|uniref:hypothetical protein n=1 Tax=Bradyrhizobium sp. dw_78 TaxID=2719793 RepID=UPI001BD324FE|nr:hypothetical protein [Bradyrhizobium sp. dw_78]
MQISEESGISHGGKKEQGFFVMRDRRSFLSEIAEHPANFARTIYSAPTRAPEKANTITVVFDLEWPEERGKPINSRLIYESTKLKAIGSEIFRVKEFLERRLLATLDLLDIRVGCIRVRYVIREGVDRFLVRSALRSLVENKDAYSVTSVSGNVEGRAVRP